MQYKPHLYKSRIPGSTIIIWYCTFRGQYAAADTFKNAYNKLALRWNNSMYGGHRMKYAK